MNYKEFTETVRDSLSGLIGLDREVMLKTNLKNNDIEKQGVIIKSPKQELSPTIYLEEYYQVYLSGKSIDEIVDDIILLSETAQLPDIDLVHNLTDFNKVKDKIMCRVINKQYNQEFLKSVPYRDFLDWAINYYILIDVVEDGCITTKVTKDLQEKWNVSENQLYEIAKENVSKTFPYKVRCVSDMFTCSDLSELCEFTEKEDMMYSVSNDSLHCGAVSIIDEELQERLYDKIGGDYYLFPSSIHDVIVSSTEYMQDKEELRDIVKSGNQYVESPEEILSYNVYKYTREDGLAILE